MLFFYSNPKLHFLVGKNINNTFLKEYFDKKLISCKKKMLNSNKFKLRADKNFFLSIRAQLSRLIIDSGIKLKKKGRYLIAECPFHQEKSPSLFVDDSKGVYHCFGCGASGNIYSFRKNLEKKIGKINNNSKIYYENSTIKSYLNSSMKIKKKQNCFTSEFLDLFLIQIANSYFYSFFSRYKKPGILLSLRNISPGIARIYEIGYSSHETKDLFEYLKNEKYSIKEILRTGIVFSKKIPYQNKKIDNEMKTLNNHYFFDMFRDRIIIPIRNCNGCVIGFGGRLISKKTSPKYINSSENNVFKKKKNIFSHSTLKESVLKDPKMVIIVEGYIDTINLFQNGIRFSVASLGTNFSFFQIKKSKNISMNKHVLIFFDSDIAGENGISRFLEKIFSPSIVKNLTLSITKIPVYFSLKDPDEFIIKKGTKNLINQVINQSVPVLIWYENFFFSELFNQYFLIEKIFFNLIILNKSLKKNLEKEKTFSSLFGIEILSESKRNLILKYFVNKETHLGYFLKNKTKKMNAELFKNSKNSIFNETIFQKIYFSSTYFPRIKQDYSCIFFSDSLNPSGFFENFIIYDLKVFVVDAKDIRKYISLKKLIFRSENKNVYEKTLLKLLNNIFLPEKTIILESMEKIYLDSSLIHENFFSFLTRERERNRIETDRLVLFYTYFKKKKKFQIFKKKDGLSSFLIEENLTKKLKIINQIDNILETLRYRTDK
jgi:DNA primase